MKLLVLVTGCLLTLQGCSRTADNVSPLQSLDATTRLLHTVTVASNAAARGEQRMSSRVQRGDATGARSEARKLKGLGDSLEVSAGAAGRDLRLVLSMGSTAQVRTYIGLLLACLGAQRDEGRALIKVAHLVSVDPLLMSPTNAIGLLAAQAAAARHAARAVREAVAARAWKRRHPAAFRYIWTRVSAPHTEQGAPTG